MLFNVKLLILLLSEVRCVMFSPGGAPHVQPLSPHRGTVWYTVCVGQFSFMSVWVLWNSWLQCPKKINLMFSVCLCCNCIQQNLRSLGIYLKVTWLCSRRPFPDLSSYQCWVKPRLSVFASQSMLRPDFLFPHQNYQDNFVKPYSWN